MPNVQTNILENGLSGKNVSGTVVGLTLLQMLVS